MFDICGGAGVSLVPNYKVIASYYIISVAIELSFLYRLHCKIVHTFNGMQFVIYLTILYFLLFISPKSLRRSSIQIQIKAMPMQKKSFKRFRKLMRYLTFVQRGCSISRYTALNSIDTYISASSL